jgi:gluconolactonase
MPSIAGTTFSLSRRSLIAGGLAVAAMPLRAQEAPRIERLSPALDRWIAPDARVETIATGVQWAEGPVWVPREHALFFSDPPANLMRRWRAGAGASPFLSPSGAAGTDPKLIREPGSNGLALAPGGHALIVADSGSRAIVRLDLASRRRTVLTDRYAGRRFNSPNDLTIARSGAIYFTDPPYGLADGDASTIREQPHNGVYRWTPRGGTELVDGTLTRPNGIALSPDERRLYVSVSDEKAPRIMVYDLDPRGQASGGRVFLDAARLHGPGLPDGMKVAADGTLFCSAPGGMYLLTPEAQPLGFVANGGPIANCCFGEDGATLFMTANHAVLRLRLRRSGWAA